MFISNFIPFWIQRIYNCSQSTVSREEIISAFAFAKIQEIKSLSIEVKNLNLAEPSFLDLLLDRRFVYPSLLSQKVQELVYISQELDSKIKSTLAPLLYFSDDDLLTVVSSSQNKNSSALIKSSSIFFDRAESILIPIEKEHPLYSTDLVVFQNSYYGPLPLNGIYEEEFVKATHLYSQIVANQTRLQIKGTPLFKVSILTQIKKLLTRRDGRDLLNQLLNPSWFVKISEIIGLSQYTLCFSDTTQKSSTKQKSYPSFAARWIRENFPTFSFLVYFFKDLELTLYFKETLDEKTTTQIGTQEVQLHSPPVITLAHELLHLSHFLNQKKWKARNFQELFKYTNEEEKVTITGQLNGKIQEQVHENSFRNQFGFYPRIYHES